MKSDSFGINMKSYCRGHETEVISAVESGDATQKLLEIHLQKLSWLQHERFVHLIVTLMTVIAELFTVGIVLLRPEYGILPAVIMLGLAVLLGFYFYHYFFLENTVQRWYVIADRLRDSLSH